MFRSFLLTLVLQQLSVEVYTGNRDFNYDPSFVRLTSTSLPESVNINKCQTSTTFTKIIQLENGFLSASILRYCGNEYTN